MNDREDMATRARDEISGMARHGLAHPSTRPVLAGMAIGAVAGAVLPVVSVPLGLAVGAGVAFWKRINR